MIFTWTHELQGSLGVGFNRVMEFNATFNNISVISWWSVLLVEKTRVPVENHWPAASHWQTLSHNVTFSCKSNSHRIKTLMTPIWTEKNPISFNSTNTLCMYWAYMNWGKKHCFKLKCCFRTSSISH